MEGRNAERVTGVKVRGAVSFEVNAEGVVFGTSSTGTVGSETGSTIFPSNGLKKRRAASNMIRYLGRGGMWNSGTRN
jgi:hypothetical protein